MNPIKIFRSNPLFISAALASVIVLLSGIVIVASILAFPGSIFPTIAPDLPTLADDQDISGWTKYDRPSYHMGQTIKQTLGILYRHDKVIPDIENLRRRMSFFPFEQRSVIETSRVNDAGITEYLIEYELQAVRVEPQQTYKIDPFILYYTSADETDENIYSQTIQAGPLHIAAFYPNYLQAVTLLPLKGVIDSAENPRRIIMIIGGVLLVGLAILILWNSGRKRRVTELTEEERLWRIFMSVETTQLDSRATLLNYEQIFTRLLHISCNVSPEDFWAGILPEDEDWKSIAEDARKVLLDNYQSPAPPDSDVANIKSLLGERLSRVVSESRLQIEQHPSYHQRLRQQPLVLMQTSIMVLLALSLLALSVMPNLWLSSELKKYNSVIASLADEETQNEQTYLTLSAMGDEASNNNIKYSALYNAGTLRATKSLSSYTPDRDNFILNAVILSESVEGLFHVLLEEGPFDEESQIVSVLIDGVEQLRRAFQDLQAAVRINPHDEDAQRNLEVVLKRRGLLVDILTQIRRFYREQREGEEEEALSDEGIINLLEAELPEDDEEEAMGKDDRGYMILERF